MRPLIKRHQTKGVQVGHVRMGDNAPVVVQSMTDTPTENVEATVRQVVDLHQAGSELVRITVNSDEAAASVIKIHDKLLKMNLDIPLIGDFHYNGHSLLTKYPECAKALAKYRINPGNVGSGEKKEKQFAMMVETALRYNKPVRIGVNWGSLDRQLVASMMDENAKRAQPKPNEQIMRDIMCHSALTSAKHAEEIGLGAEKIVISCKMSAVQDLIAVYQQLAQTSDYALHLGLTEAGMGMRGMVASSAALAVLLQKGIGDTIRVSLTPEPGAPRRAEVEVAQQILQSLELRSFVPGVIACPGCGRTTSSYFQELAKSIEGHIKKNMPEWRIKYPGVEDMNVAVMGCIVNGPGESKHANIGISLPGTGESPAAPIFVDGKKFTTLKGEGIAEEFQTILDDYVHSTYG